MKPPNESSQVKIKNGWVNEYGYYYYYQNGVKLKNTFVTINNQKYFLTSSGRRAESERLYIHGN